MKNIEDLFNSSVNVNEIEKQIVSVGVYTASFWTLQNVAQRTIGLIGLHAAKPFPVTFGIGLLVTSSNLVLSHCIHKQVQDRIPLLIDSVLRPTIFDRRPTNSNKSDIRKELIQQIFVATPLYLMLEGGSFRTAFPSSVIAPGVFVNFGNVYKNSIIATSDVATASERAKIQKLGKVFGCHQCGSRHLFTKESFIADHMPPTKFANQMNDKWWRKLFKIEVRQRLWAQCRSCFSMQGNAVRANLHKPVYHMGLCSHHFAPAIAFILLQRKDFCELTDFVVEPTLHALQSAERSIRQRLKI